MSNDIFPLFFQKKSLDACESGVIAKKKLLSEREARAGNRSKFVRKEKRKESVGKHHR